MVARLEPSFLSQQIIDHPSPVCVNHPRHWSRKHGGRGLLRWLDMPDEDLQIALTSHLSLILDCCWLQILPTENSEDNSSGPYKQQKLDQILYWPLSLIERLNVAIDFGLGPNLSVVVIYRVNHNCDPWITPGWSLAMAMVAAMRACARDNTAMCLQPVITSEA